ncbi:hypothetical protein SPHV1_520023 [Novosphingobium sp. KN65.2]|nr:hypothetical protein SPHV1_520023 [Novosphingobium sp. KN65.2]
MAARESDHGPWPHLRSGRRPGTAPRLSMGDLKKPQGLPDLILRMATDAFGGKDANRKGPDDVEEQFQGLAEHGQKSQSGGR